MMTLRTKRLILRPWQEEDLEPFAKLNADPRVMQYFPSCLSKEESDQMVERIKSKMKKSGWGFWAAELAENRKFIGFIGLNALDKEVFPVPFVPTVEVGWRLGYEAWGKGYATEGAHECLKFGFKELNLPEIVAFTATQNLRSIKVMQRLGMHHSREDDFDNPKIPEGQPLRKHVLYRIKQREWKG